MPTLKKELRFPALEIAQGPHRKLYSFAVEGKELHTFATVSRIRRSASQKMSGYQRPEVRSHIREIKSYIESESPMIPNALVIAFDKRVRFESAEKRPRGRRKKGDFTSVGEIVVPVELYDSDADKPGWIVDGQQRAAAMREAVVDSFPIPVTGFITGNEEEQREQFILVNSTKPLPRSLIHELLPSTNAKLASHLQKRRFPARILERLNFDEDSPLQCLIQTPTTPMEKVDGTHFGIIKDNSILKMVENSLSDGLLYLYRDHDTGEGDMDKMLCALKNYWSAVAEVFPDGWGLPPRKSRLMHGAGIVSLGFIMDAIADRFRGELPLSKDRFVTELTKIQSDCRWTNGYWSFGRGVERKWNELQNTGKDITLLTNHLLISYRKASRPERSS